MNYEVCILTSIDEFVIKRITKTPKSSISALLRDCRKRVPLIGDQVILIHIIRLLKANNYEFSYYKLIQALQSSEDYKEMTRGEKTKNLRYLTKQCNLKVELPRETVK